MKIQKTEESWNEIEVSKIIIKKIIYNFMKLDLWLEVSKKIQNLLIIVKIVSVVKNYFKILVLI